MKMSSLSKLVKLTQANRPLAVTLLCAGVLGSVGHSAFAANDLWIGNTDANFNTLANWTGSVTPAGNAPEFGAAGTSGTALTNDLTNATYAGLLFDSGASAYTIGGNSFTLTGNITNNSTSTEAINTAINLNGARTISAASGQLVLGGNITGTPGNTILTATNQITLSGTNNVTMSANFAGLNVSGAGGVDITGSTIINGAANNTQSGYMNVSGTTSVTVESGATLQVNGTTNNPTGGTPNSIVGQNAAGTSTLLVNGGSLTIGGNTGLAFGNNAATATGILTINSGTATITAGSSTLQDVRNFVALGRDNATGIVNLNGGTLATGRQFVRDGNNGGTVGAGTATFNFNGGTLQAQANQTQGNGWFETATTGNFQVVTTNVLEGGAKIDTNGFNVNIQSVLAHGGSNAIDGGLTKIGAGTLTLGSGTDPAFTGDTFTGNVVVNAGTLSLASNITLNSAIVMSLAPSTSLDLGFASGSQTVAGLLLNGVSVAPGTYTSSDLNTLGSSSLITFTSSGGTLTVAAVPEPATMALLSIGLVCVLFGFRRHGRKAAI